MKSAVLPEKNISEFRKTLLKVPVAARLGLATVSSATFGVLAGAAAAKGLQPYLLKGFSTSAPETVMGVAAMLGAIGTSVFIMDKLVKPNTTALSERMIYATNILVMTYASSAGVVLTTLGKI